MTALPNRRSVRLRNYDYSTADGYFATICTAERQPLFANPQLRAIVDAAWHDIPNHHPHVEFDEFVVMPNHVHGILFLGTGDANRERAQRVAPLQRNENQLNPNALGAIVRAFKARVTRDLCVLTGTNILVWQRNYHEHVIRDEDALQRIRQYIVDNPARWAFDRDNPSARPDGVEREFDEWLVSQTRHFASRAPERR